MRVVKALGHAPLGFFRSIRFRITLWFVLILAIVLAAFSIFIYFTQFRDLQYDAVGNMQDKLATLANLSAESGMAKLEPIPH